MRKLLLIASVGAALAVAVAPAVAATPATFDITAGGISLSAPEVSVLLGARTAVVGVGAAISGPLGVVSVTDNRGGTTGWTASVISTAFLGPVSVAALNVSYAVGTITGAGPATFTPTAGLNLTGVVPVVAASLVTGANSASWNPTVTVATPAGLAVGTYSATITHSVA
jgi:hypothetical protein